LKDEIEVSIQQVVESEGTSTGSVNAKIVNLREGANEGTVGGVVGGGDVASEEMETSGDG